MARKLTSTSLIFLIAVLGKSREGQVINTWDNPDPE